MMSKPNVDVVIPVHGKSSLVLRLMSSLRNMKRVNSVILIDDGSSEQDREVLATIQGVKYFRHNASEGFVKSCLHGARKADAPYLLFLNSDTEAYNIDSVANMAENLDDGAAVCGALLLYPKTDPYRAERIQHAGVAIGFDSYPYHVLSNMHAQTPAAHVRRRVTAVTGACLMITRDWWEKSGKFDTRFGNGVFEDVSLCLTVNKLGGEVIYEPSAVFYHAEHQSQGQNGNWFTRDYLNKNFQYLLLKHGTIPCDDQIWYKGV